MHVSTASSWGFASPPNNKCMSSAGGRPSTATATFFSLNIPTYVPCLSIVPVRDNENNHNLFVFAQVCFCLPNNGSGLRDWSLGVELWALSNALWHLALSTGSGDSALGVGHCALGIGHWALSACPLPTPSESVSDLPRSLWRASPARDVRISTCFCYVHRSS